MEKFKTYTRKILKGSVGDFATEWWTEEDWERHRKYVEELKASGEYLQPIEISLTVKECPLLDSIQTKSENYKFILLDLSK